MSVREESSKEKQYKKVKQEFYLNFETISKSISHDNCGSLFDAWILIRPGSIATTTTINSDVRAELTLWLLADKHGNFSKYSAICDWNNLPVSGLEVSAYQQITRSGYSGPRLIPRLATLASTRATRVHSIVLRPNNYYAILILISRSFHRSSLIAISRPKCNIRNLPRSRTMCPFASCPKPLAKAPTPGK